MPNTLPVPSKAALRALRRIVLGTSCTVAFSTGLLTEDRRRRIHAAREVHNNAKLLKSSRKYHSGGSPSIELFEEQVMRYSDDGIWLAKDSFKVQSAQVAIPLELSIPDFLAPRREPQPFKTSRQKLLTSVNMPGNRSLIQPNKPQALALGPGSSAKSVPSPSPQSHKRVYGIGEPAGGTGRYRQRKLYVDVIRRLENEDDPSKTETAALYLLDALKEDFQIEDSGLIKELTDTAVRVSRACQIEGKFDLSEKLLVVMASFGPISEKVFHSLGAEGVIRDLITGFDQSGNFKMDVSRLQRAAALYLTKFAAKPGVSKDSWRILGEILCGVTYRYGLYDLTENVYWRLEKSRGDSPNRCVYHLIAALHKQDRYKEVVKLSRRLLPSASLSKSNFYTTGDIVIDSALQIRRLDFAEEALLNLVKMSKDAEQKCSTTWFLKVLGDDWRTYHDISRTRTLFKRLEPHFDLVVHPQAAYGAMIQFCIEAGDEIAARWYYEHKVEKMPVGSAVKLELRIQGHFAYAKAIRGDWAGVKEDFSQMRQLSPSKYEFSASFTPILNLFAKSHSVHETEEFIRSFIDRKYVVLTPYMSTTMINKYGASREIDSIFRWLDYMVSIQSPPDPMLFNAIIHNCRTKWKFSFEETYRLFQKVRKMGGTATRFINKDTISILRGAAMARSGSNVGKAVNKLHRLKLDQPLTPPVDSKSVQEHMAIAMAKGSPRRALRIYEKAQNGVIPVAGACISAAVQAALTIEPNDIHAAASLLQQPQKDGYDIGAAVAIIFVHQLSYHSTDHLERTTELQGLARRTISVLEERGVDVPPSMLTHTIYTLVSRQRYYQAIDFWKAMAANQKALSSLDLPTLTVLLQAYIGARDCAGVEWVIQMVSSHDFLPDHIFKRPLKKALTGMRKALASKESGYVDRRFYLVVENALRSVSAMRGEATRDRESVKTMTIKIMEKAIEIGQVADSVKAEDAREISFKTPLIDGERISSSISARPLGSSTWRPIEESGHDLFPIGKFVGVQAG